MPLILIDPTAEEDSEKKAGAARLGTLSGKRIGLLDNIKHNAEYLLAEVGEQLVRDYGCEVRMVRKKTYTKYAEPHVLAALEDCDAVVTAIGD
ncbi:MAG: hypothetical protein JNM90_00695 [Burkholderiales bacterium]|nr:hypothetical protein [Burkholderiales bacterium]